MQSVILTIKVTPRAKQRRCIYDAAGYIRVYVAAIPEHGAANEELIAFLAKALQLPRQGVAILSGATSRIKRIAIETDMTLDDIYKRLGLDEAFQREIIQHSSTRDDFTK